MLKYLSSKVMIWGCLGDIHKRQHLNKKKPYLIVVLGSTKSRRRFIHGYLLWDVPKRKSKYIEIPNDYGYYTLDIKDGKVPECDDMPKRLD